MSTVDLAALKPYCDSGVDLRNEALQVGQGAPSENFANDAQKRDAL